MKQYSVVLGTSHTDDTVQPVVLITRAIVLVHRGKIWGEVEGEGKFQVLTSV